ncbi:MAG: ferredoxin oxidoreductase [Acidobacteria bacterium]|jgi:2-oxoglutarate ferredoxin oxidoreductase subunit alpha|nr:ferredoxin oxidoreductase [Acidobacteriota bacterium]MDP7479620.1 2-oxoacid:acceptor oxidoreductase subunit alpha [Vicinamibacterales bacterium]HJN44237.1 2-oxoacid:acceptor oxidoreductase subunit alpha [Vicinamibacterales bacterium]
MSASDVAGEERPSEPSIEFSVNDFTVQVATVNGSGSQTANLVLLRSIFQMGVPVSAKNLFPSNIAGLPTWFTIRVNKNGYIGWKKKSEILVAMNSETAQEDVLNLDAGSAVIYDEPLKLNSVRSDVVFYPVPFEKLVAEVSRDVKLRRRVRNMIYDGVLARLLGIELDQMEAALRKQFGNKEKVVAINRQALDAGYAFAKEHLEKRDPCLIEAMDENQGRILIDGNSAAAIGCMMAGVTVVTWYPITPSSSLCETLIDYLRKYRVDKETGKATFAVVQAEDEIAALGMALGAGWAGGRSMTATSGPGISLMGEFAGLGYYAEVPAVIFDVQRVGPATGLPTRTAQGDVLSTAFLSHGDTRHPLLFPSSPDECYSMAVTAFDLAERFQTPIFVLSDLDLGMNTWMSPKFEYPSKPIDRGKLLDAEALERIGRFGRYRDVDGDGIPYRSVPGNEMPAYFCRGSGHNDWGQYSERSDDYRKNVDRLTRKFETARNWMPAPIVEINRRARVGIIAYGTTHWAVVESRDQLKEEADVRTSYYRLRAYPFRSALASFIERHDRVYVVEQNRDAQMATLMRLELRAELAGRLRSVLNYAGEPVAARTITDDILIQEGYRVQYAVADGPSPHDAGVGGE